MRKIFTKACLFFAIVLLTGNVNAQGYQCDGNNVLSGIPIQQGDAYFAPGWKNSSNYTETWENGILTLQLKDATFEAWQAQFPLSVNPTTLIANKVYFLSFDIETSVALPRVYMKVHKDKADDNYIDIPFVSIVAGKQTVSGIFNNTGGTTITEFNKILFDFGGNPANVDIVISNITICDGYSGESVTYNCNGENKFSAENFSIEPPYFAPGWNNSSNYTETWGNGILTLQLNDATFEAWQAQFAVTTTSAATVVADKKYLLSFDIETSIALPRVYLKIQKGGDDDHYMDIPSLSVTAGKQTVSHIFENTGATTTTEINKVLFDFGGNPANANIVISNITICDNYGEANSIPEVISDKGISYNQDTNVIQINAENGIALSSLYTIGGRIAALGTSEINISSLSKGIYILHVKDLTGNVSAFKIMLK